MARKTPQERVQKGLLDLALGSTNDAVSILFMTDEEIIEKLPKLKLFNVSEIKKPKGGGMEIKFFDRLKAMEKINEVYQKENSDGCSFYEALEKSALASNQVSDD